MYRPLIIAAALLTLAGAPAIAATSPTAPTQTTQTSAKIVRHVSAKPAGKVVAAKTEVRKGAASHRTFAKLVRHGHRSKVASKTVKPSKVAG